MFVSARSAAMTHVELTVTVRRAVCTAGVIVTVDDVIADVVGPVVIEFTLDATTAVARSVAANDFILVLFK